MKLNRNKALAMLASFLILTAAIGIGVWSLGSPSTTVTITPQSLVDAYSYVVFAEGSTYYLKNGSNSQIEYSSTNVTLVEQYALGNLTVSGGSVFLKGIAHNTSLTFGNNIFLTTELAGIIEYWAGGTMVFHVAYDGVYLPDADIEASAIYMSGNIAFNKYQATAMVFYKGTSFPASPVAGEPFYRTDLNTLYVYDGAAWNNAGTGAIDSAASYSYLIFINGTTTYMKDGTTGKVVYSSANASKVFLFALGNCSFGYTINVRNGNYLIDTTLTISQGGITIAGESYGGARLILTTANIPLIKYTSPAMSYLSRLENLWLQGGDLAGTIGVLVDPTVATISDIHYLNLIIQNFGRAAIEMRAYSNKTWNHWIEHCLLEDIHTGYGVYLTNTTSGTASFIDRVSITQCHFFDNLNSLYCDSPYVWHVDFTDNTVERERQDSVKILGGRQWTIEDNRIFDCSNATSQAYGGIMINGSLGYGLGQWPQGIIISGNTVGNHFYAFMNYSVWLTGYMQNVTVSGNYFASSDLKVRLDGLNVSDGFGVIVRGNDGFVSPEDSVGSEAIRVGVDGTYYYALNCTSGIVMERSANASQVINNAVNNASAVKGSVFIEAGDYPISPSVDANFNNTMIFGEGVGTRLYLPDGQPTGGASDYVYHRIFTITNCEDVTIQNLCFDGNYINNDWTAGEKPLCYINNSRYVTVQDCLFENGRTYGVSVFCSSGVSYGSKIIGNTVRDCLWNGIELNSYGGAVSKSIIEGNLVTGSCDIGISLLSDGVNLTEYCSVVGNIVYANGTGWGSGSPDAGFGIRLEDAANCLVANNIIMECNTGYSDGIGGNNTITGNVIQNNAGNTWAGIELFTENNTVTGNRLNIGWKDGSVGIEVYGNMNRIQDNDIFNAGGFPNVYGIDEAPAYNPNGTIVKDNRIVGCGYPINFASGTGQVVQQNIGFVTENTILNVANTTATTFVFNHGCTSTVNSVLPSFNFTGWTSWTWTSTTTQVTVTITGTLPAAMEILAADVKYIP